MSWKVVEEVADKAQSRHGTRNVLWAIAEVAHHDGVGWLKMGPETDPDTIAYRAKLSERQVRRAVEAGQRHDELEVRIAQVGKRRYYVYRVTVGRMREKPVDYTRLPALTSQFWTVEELTLPRDERRPDEKIRRAPRPDEMSGRTEADDRTSEPVTTGQIEPVRADISYRDDRTSAPGQRAREKNTVQGPGPGTVQKNGPAAEVTERESDSSAAATIAEAPRLTRIVEVLDELAGADFDSLRQVEPLAIQLDAEGFEKVVERVRARIASGDVGNETGLLVHLLRVDVEARRRAWQAGRVAAMAAYDDERLERRRVDPRGYLHRLLALPSSAHPEVIAAFLDRYIDDPAERARLAEEERQTRDAIASPVGAVQHWARWVGRDLDTDVVHQQIDEWLDLWQVTDPIERQLHHDEAEREATAARLELAPDAEAEAA